MATKAGVGVSRHHNPNVAGREAAEQALQNAGVSKPDFVLMFGSIGYDQHSLVRAVREATGGAPLSGCGAGEPPTTSIIFRRQLINIATTKPSLMGSPTRCSRVRHGLVGLSATAVSR